MLDGLGLKQDEDFKSIYLDRAGDGPAMVLDGRVAALWGAGIGWPGFAAVAIEPGRRALHRPRCRGDRAHPRQAQLPQAADGAGRQLSGQTAPIASVGSWSFVLARDSLPDDVAYRLARTLHGVEATFCKKLAQACETTAANTVAAAPEVALIHPGVLKYFREIGGGEVTGSSRAMARSRPASEGRTGFDAASGSDIRRLLRATS